jgi:hypothetical protein
MGLTFLEARKSEVDPLRRALINELSQGELLGIIPFENVENGGVQYNQTAELPSVAFRGVNEVLPSGYGVINPQFEAWKMMGGDIDVDTSIINTQGEGEIAKQVTMGIQSMRMAFEDKFINGDETLNPREFDGLKKRVPIGSSQAISAGGALSLTKLDELIDACDAAGGQQKVLVMNRTIARLLNAASRDTTKSGFIVHDRDQFGRRVATYNDCLIVRTMVNGQNQEVQPFTESGSSTSVYCISFGDLLTTAIQGRVGQQFGPSIRPLGEVDDAPVNRTRLEWYAGLAIYHGRSVARLHGVTNAAVIA